MTRSQINIRLSDKEKLDLLKLAEELYEGKHIEKPTITELMRGIVEYIKELENKV